MPDYLPTSASAALGLLARSFGQKRAPDGRFREKTQRAAIGVEMLPLLGREAKERQRNGAAMGGETAGKGRPKSGSDSLSVTLREGCSPAGRSADIAAEAVKVGASSIGRARQVKDRQPASGGDRKSEQAKSEAVMLPPPIKAKARGDSARKAKGNTSGNFTGSDFWQVRRNRREGQAEGRKG